MNILIKWKNYNNHQVYNWIFVMILVISTILLLTHIGSRTLWMDETAALEYLSQTPGQFLINYFSVPDNHPPFFYLLVIIFQNIFPTTELGIRLVSILSSLGIVVITYLLSFFLFENRKLSLVTMMATSFSAYFLLIGQMARYHSLAAFLSLLAIYLLLKLLKFGYHAWQWWLFLVIVVLVGWVDYVHFIYIFGLINLLVIIWLVMKRKFFISWLRWWLGQAIIVLSFIPMIWLIYLRMIYQGDSGFIGLSVLGNSISQWVLSFFMHGYVYFFTENILPWNFTIFGLGLIIIAVLIWRLIKLLKAGFKSAESSWLLFILLSASIIGNVIFLNIFNPRFNFIVYPKYVFVAYPLFVILVVKLLFFGSKKYINYLLIISYIIIQLFGIYHFYNQINYLNASYFNNFSGFEFINDNARLGDFLILSGDLNEGVYRFYQEKYFNKVIPVSLLDYQNYLQKSSNQRFWFFATGSDDKNINNEPSSKIPTNLKIVKEIYSVPLDPVLVKLKEKILQRSSYKYKYGVFLLTT